MSKIAFVFSGQGAQYTGMGQSLYNNSKAAKAVFNMVDIIREGTSKQCFESSAEELSETINTQPCVFTVDLAAARACEEAGIVPEAVAGFSLGEIPTLSFSGILSEEEAFRLVCKRAEYMNYTATKQKGTMIAVLKLSAEQVESICQDFDNTYPVNYNCPGQTVVATAEENAEAFSNTVKEAGGKAVRLAVSGAFHSPFMNEAAEYLSEYLETVTVKKPKIKAYSNVTGQGYCGDIPDLIKLQVKSPVKWQSIIEDMIENGIDTFIEVGPGKTLSGLIKKISKDVAVYNAETFEDIQKISEDLKG
ncbi:MAG: ACP S-malonyltransferase [Bacillota bacterium]|nr:ACP S-malonyltransferase [Bacillota bacterium]